MSGGHYHVAASDEMKHEYYDAFVDALPSLAGKVVCVTGTTSGTGFFFALAAAKKGATVVLLNRPSERADAALKRLKADCPGGVFDSRSCDLQAFSSVQNAVKGLHETYNSNGIDVICCNAGVMALPDQATIDGYDLQVQTNHLSHFMLVQELFPLLETAANARGEARIVNHSSIARNGCKIIERYFCKEGGHLGGNGSSMFCGGARWVRYSQTKLANSVWTMELDRRLKAANSKVIAVCAAPGLSKTNLQVTTLANGGMSSGCCGSMWIMRFAQSAGDGSMGILQAAFGEKDVVEGGQLWEPHGMFAVGGPVVVAKPTPAEIDPAAGALLWELSEKATNKKFSVGGE